MRYRGIKGKCWEALRHYVLKRDGGKCCTCNKTLDQGYVMQAGHFQPVGLVGSNNTLSWDEYNVHAQCARCNGFGQGEQVKMEAYIREKYGEEKVKELWERRYKVDPIKDWDRLLAYYTVKFNELENVL